MHDKNNVSKLVENNIENLDGPGLVTPFRYNIKSMTH